MCPCKNAVNNLKNIRRYNNIWSGITLQTQNYTVRFVLFVISEVSKNISI